MRGYWIEIIVDLVGVRWSVHVLWHVHCVSALQSSSASCCVMTLAGTIVNKTPGPCIRLEYRLYGYPRHRSPVTTTTRTTELPRASIDGRVFQLSGHLAGKTLLSLWRRSFGWRTLVAPLASQRDRVMMNRWDRTCVPNGNENEEVDRFEGWRSVENSTSGCYSDSTHQGVDEPVGWVSVWQLSYTLQCMRNVHAWWPICCQGAPLAADLIHILVSEHSMPTIYSFHVDKLHYVEFIV